MATRNPEKINVIRGVWDGKKIRSLRDENLMIPGDIERANTYQENAMAKADWIWSRLTGDRLVLADDMGMEIRGLGGQPGVRTRRWGRELSDEELLNKTLQAIRELDEEGRQCDFVACAVAILNQRERWSVFERDSGILLLEPRGPLLTGHPLASLLFLPEHNATLSELKSNETFAAKDIRAHRRLRTLLSHIINPH